MDHLKSDSPNNSPCVDCTKDPIESLKAMFVDMVQAGRIRKGQCPAMRPVFLKPHGIAAAEFKIRDDLPEKFRIGLFSNLGKSYPTWVRFSSDTTPTNTDFKSTLGIGIKLFDVEGEKYSATLMRVHLISLCRILMHFLSTLQKICVNLPKLV
ncbi:hypothetical protein F896_01692 [Acinetobacter genomosp. 15BJ]|uniref:Uncharacterized protein n=1 Tax=Acinetobacter genomosp. 15BJ TaxID=106651 RepID=R9B296_9GAMM|nr:hypothetical protein F896_01692 [Acinetobacter genomosp. 15BJ]